jgi:hypothetical protein
LSLVNRLPWLLVNPEFLLVVVADAWRVTASAVRGLLRGGAL